MKLSLLFLFAICIILPGFSQQMDAYSIHYGNFHAWSPSLGGGVRIAGASPSAVWLNGLRYPYNYSKQNGFMGRMKRNGQLDFLHFVTCEGYYEKLICTENSTLFGFNMDVKDSFITDKSKYMYYDSNFDGSSCMAQFKNGAKPTYVSFSRSGNTARVLGGVRLTSVELDSKDNIHFTLVDGTYMVDGFKSYVHFGGNYYDIHSYARGTGRSSYFLGSKSASNVTKGISVHFNKGGNVRVTKGNNGGAFVYGHAGDSIVLQKVNYKANIKFDTLSNYILELDSNWQMTNSFQVRYRDLLKPMLVDKNGLQFMTGTLDSVKIGDTTLYNNAKEDNWLMRAKSGAKADVLTSYKGIRFESHKKFETSSKQYMAITRFYNDTVFVNGKEHFLPAATRAYGTYVSFFDNDHNLVNIIPGITDAKFGSNGKVYVGRRFDRYRYMNIQLPDTVVNSIDSLDQTVVVELDQEFIYSNLITPGFSYCPGERIKVVPMSIEKFDSNNVFTMELSDSNGHFINPTVIGSLKSSVLDTVVGVVPNALGSKHYRVRLVSSSPKHIGLDNAFDVEVKEPAASPNASDVYYCQGETAVQLSPSGNGVRWYSKPSDTTGGGLVTPPTPSTASAGITTYLVTQPDAICGISARLVDVHVQAPKGLPAFSDTYYCKDDSATMLNPMGKDIRWYTNPADTLNKGLSTPPIPITTTIGTQTYLVTQYDSVCGDFSAEVKVHVQAPYQLPNTVDRNYCVGDTAVALGPSGNGLIWYTNPSDTSGKGTAVPPTPSTLIPSLQTYLISTQHDTVCPVSTKLVNVNVQAPLDTPIITQKDTLLISSLSNNIKWYKNSTAISRATKDTLVHSGNGLYKVVYTDSNGCQSFDTVAIKSVSIQTGLATQVQAYPNPFGHQIQVDFEGLRNVRLFNANGQLVMESQGKILNTSSILPGLYHLEVSTQSGEVYRKKMVKY